MSNETHSFFIFFTEDQILLSDSASSLAVQVKSSTLINLSIYTPIHISNLKHKCIGHLFLLVKLFLFCRLFWGCVACQCWCPAVPMLNTCHHQVSNQTLYLTVTHFMSLILCWKGGGKELWLCQVECISQSLIICLEMSLPLCSLGKIPFIHVGNQVVSELGPIVQFTKAKVSLSLLKKQIPYESYHVWLLSDIAVHRVMLWVTGWMMCRGQRWRLTWNWSITCCWLQRYRPAHISMQNF